MHLCNCRLPVWHGLVTYMHPRIAWCAGSEHHTLPVAPLYCAARRWSGGRPAGRVMHVAFRRRRHWQFPIAAMQVSSRVCASGSAAQQQCRRRPRAASARCLPQRAQRLAAICRASAAADGEEQGRPEALPISAVDLPSQGQAAGGALPKILSTWRWSKCRRGSQQALDTQLAPPPPLPVRQPGAPHQKTVLPARLPSCLLQWRAWQKPTISTSS